MRGEPSPVRGRAMGRPMTPYHRQVTIDAADRDDSLQHLRRLLAEARKSEYVEIWVDHGDYPSLCALIHGDSGWLMYLRYNGDAGFSTRNLGYTGPKDAVIDYYLSNGQRDEYPASWALPKERLLEAVECFASRGESPEWITWFNDSGDGNASPNDEFEALE